MCLVNEKPVKPGKSIVGWKVFIKTPEGELIARYAGWDEEPYKRGEVYTAVYCPGKRSWKADYVGFHGFTTRQAARDYSKEAGKPFSRGHAVIRKCVFFDVTATGSAEAAYSTKSFPSFRANKMIIL